ncbi:MAG TPA: glucose-6-phosphate dehydrogenase [Nitrospiraceae bacterium]|nr:glucose-6-phosphate dehydrogenase [Nitrospiraceae bacterium]
MIKSIVILGASGDLTSRFLMPAIARLHQAEKLPADFRIIGLARDPWDTAAFRRHLEGKMTPSALSITTGARDAVLARTEYRRVDVTDGDQIAAALGRVTDPLVAYLALPPSLFPRTVETLAALNLPRGSKIVLEKPFGTNLASAQELNCLLHESFPEQDVFRLDHFLGMQTVQNMLGLRFANRVFEPLWNAQHIERVDIVWDETLTVAGRAVFYDGTGALRDMIQNHLLQLLALIAMEPLHRLDERSVRDRKVDVLRAVRRLSPDEIVRHTVRGRYGRGAIDEREIPAYTRESGVDPNRHTETFAQVRLAVDNWRWAGVPFLLRTGKALKRDRREIAIRFKPVPHLAFGQQAQPKPNVLTIELDPDRIGLSINVNAPGDLFDLDRAELDSTLGSGGLPTYARLLLNVLNGDQTLSIRDDEAEESWRIVEPILEAWARGAVPLIEYPAGSSGPAS